MRFFSISMEVDEAKKRIMDELKNFSVIKEPGKTFFAKVCAPSSRVKTSLNATNHVLRISLPSHESRIRASSTDNKTIASSCSNWHSSHSAASLKIQSTSAFRANGPSLTQCRTNLDNYETGKVVCGCT
jgi:hypothetical protein